MAESALFIKVACNTGRIHCINPHSITHFHHQKVDGVDCFRCYFGGGENDTVDVPRGEFEKKILPWIRLTE